MRQIVLGTIPNLGMVQRGDVERRAREVAERLGCEIESIAAVPGMGIVLGRASVPEDWTEAHLDALRNEIALALLRP